jgi:hypothetical protein
MPNRKSLLTNSLVKKDKAERQKGVRYLGFDGVNTFSFSIKSETREHTFHHIKLELTELYEAMLDLVDVKGITDIALIKSVITYAMTLSIKVYCSCEDFLYSGTKYWNYKNGSGIEEETRPPQPWKLAKRSLLCKHIRYILQNISRYTNVMARSVSKAYEKEWMEYAAEQEAAELVKIADEIENIEDTKKKSKSSKTKQAKTPTTKATKSKKNISK